MADCGAGDEVGRPSGAEAQQRRRHADQQGRWQRCANQVWRLVVLLLLVAKQVVAPFLLLLKARPATIRWAWQAGPAYSCRCNGGLAQEATETGPGCAGPVLFKATHRGPGWA
eukprot:2710169-Amphidinium_carterae.1